MTLVLSVLAPTAMATKVLTVRMKKKIRVVLNNDLLPHGFAPFGVAISLVGRLLYAVLVIVRLLVAVLLMGLDNLWTLQRLPIGDNYRLHRCLPNATLALARRHEVGTGPGSLLL